MSERGKRVLIADDQPAVLAAVVEYLQAIGYTPIPCRDGGEALAVIRTDPPDLLVVDASMPVLSGMDVIRHLRFLCGNAFVPVLVITGRTDPEIHEAALRAGAHRVLTKPFRLADLASALAELENLGDTAPCHLDAALDLEPSLRRAIPGLSGGNAAVTPMYRAMADALSFLVRATDAQDPHGPYHSLHVAELSQLVAVTMGLNPGQLPRVRLAGLLHDIGKLAFPPDLLAGRRPMAEADRETVYNHPLGGARLVEPLDADLARVIALHHERWDGRGYPEGLHGEEIPVISRILCVCDAYSAMTMRSGYGEPLSPGDALDELERCAGTQFDPSVVAAMASLLTEPAPCLSTSP